MRKNQLEKLGFQQMNQWSECYFYPSNNTSSATICANCGKEKFIHTIGEGIKASKSVIIPQEEPKQIKCYCGHTITCDCEPLQETLEEASHTAWLNYEHVEGNLYSTSFKNGFKFGAKWQAERSQMIVPPDATNIEVFAIKPDENGKLFAYIGYKTSNGNFEFSTVPFTEPKPERMYSEEEVESNETFKTKKP
jgi:hypothetical protein